eukprot:CAMPEP_0114342330 /NCGR_PEP_ID=MMETSP0101-20121206/9723_1 /TAXON_ID=38822 ORGANISM="Pteridomonas danica, Strain PT" /NCGR_SAMPLE_ID=MMETSP0101 /ASSEMBLY_ACC=CAM_ASM_000211 /LENGTH=247 /DNA_ID=CAMNT_0001476393 /DNA_START=475 /DNA_END=1218 /DNA_ORIENTATION=-
MATASKAMNKAVIKCAEAANNYSNVPITENPDNNDRTSFKKPIALMGGVLNVWGRKSALEPAILIDVMSTCIDYELMSVSAFRDLLSTRDNHYIEFEKLSKKHTEHSTAKETGKTETKGSRFSEFLPKSMVAQPKPIEDAIESAKIALDTQEEICKACTGALFNTEFKKFENDRASQFKLIVSMVGAGMLKSQGDVAKAWDNSTANIKTDILLKRMNKLIPDFEDYNNKHGTEEESGEDMGGDDGTD